MNAVTTRAASATAIAALGSLRQNLQNVAAAIPTTTGDPYLRMEKDGTWVYGQDNVEVEPGSLWAVNLFSIKHGYVCWTAYEPDPTTKKQQKNEKLGEMLVPSGVAKPARESLPDHGWPWKDAMSVELVCVSGEDKGEKTLYNVNSTGGLNAFAKLVDAIQNQLATPEGMDKPVPLIELLHDTYPHKTWGKVYVPILEIKGWVPLTDGLPEVDGEVEDAKEAVVEQKPVRKRQASVPASKQAEKKPEPNKLAEGVDTALKDMEQLAQAIETKEERKARLMREMEELEADEGGEADSTDVQRQAETPAPEQTGGAEVRRRRRVA